MTAARFRLKPPVVPEQDLHETRRCDPTDRGAAMNLICGIDLGN